MLSTTLLPFPRRQEKRLSPMNTKISVPISTPQLRNQSTQRPRTRNQDLSSKCARYFKRSMACGRSPEAKSMSNRCGLLSVVAVVFTLSCAVAPVELYAQEKDRGPQGNQQITQLANGLAASTRAQADEGGLRVNTDVPIPVPGV